MQVVHFSFMIMYLPLIPGLLVLDCSVEDEHFMYLLWISILAMPFKRGAVPPYFINVPPYCLRPHPFLVDFQWL